MPSPSIQDQVAAARRSVLAVPTPELAGFLVTGPDRLSWLNGMLTCELQGRSVGDVVYGLQVALKGRIVSDVLVVIERERVVLLAQRASAEALREMLERHLMMEDAVVVPAFDAFTVWMLHGPRAAEVLVTARAAGASGGALDRTGLGGAIAIAEGGHAPVEHALLSGVAATGGLLGDEAGWDVLRLERGVPKFGADFDATTYPQEAGLEKTAVSFSKGCYLGQEVVCMLELRGHVKRKLVALTIDGDGVPAAGSPVEDGGAAVGEVTSAAWSPTLGRAVALAMVKFASAQQGGAVSVAGRRAEMVQRPA